jgi:hypothetical protein
MRLADIHIRYEHHHESKVFLWDVLFYTALQHK